VVYIDFDHVEQVSQVFFDESKEILADLDALILKLEDSPTDLAQVNVLFRRVHTLKGSVGAVPGGQLLGSLAHEFEALLSRIKKENRVVTKPCVDLFLHSSRLLKVLAENLREGRELYPEELSEVIELITRYGQFQFSDSVEQLAPTVSPRATKNSSSQVAGDDEGVWLSNRQLEAMLRLSGELLVLKNHFQLLQDNGSSHMSKEVREKRQVEFTQNLTKISDQFQVHLMQVRKATVGSCFEGVNILLRQAATELNKDVKLNSQGFDLLIDRSLGQDLYDALIHLIRNSVDHGIEDQFDRTTAGKNSTGQIDLNVSEKNGVVHLEIKDDGKGLDRERILARALQNGLVDEDSAKSLTDDQVFRFIFKAGFSTKDKVTTISGRGVGMDVVQAIVDKYGGKIHIESSIGQGTTFRLEVPIPQNIMVESSLLCRWKDYAFAAPLGSVAHISSVSELQVTSVDYLRFCQFEGLTVPLMSYHEMLYHEIDRDFPPNASAVFVRTKEGMIALLVDKIDGQSDLVVKSFGKVIKSMPGLKGVSVLADETVCYVVDPSDMIQLLRQNESKEKAAA